MTESSTNRKNTLGKGEIARYEQFLLFPKCFQKTHTTDMLKPGLVWERLKGMPGKGLRSKYRFFSQLLFLPYKRQKLPFSLNLFIGIFFLFPQCFLPYQRQK